jgi:hypothetical protein
VRVRSKNVSVCIATGYGLDRPGFGSRPEQQTFLYSTASKPDLSPTQPPTQWVPGAFPLG